MVDRKRSFSPIRTKYPGVYVILGTDPLGDPQRIFYVSYRRSGKQHFEKIGREGDRTEDGEKITEAVAAGIRSDKIKGRVLPNRDRRAAERAEVKAVAERWTLSKLWTEYKAGKPKRSATDETNFTKHLSPSFGDKEPRELVPLDVDRLRMKLSKKLAAGTVKNVLELLRRLSNFAANKRLCDPLPFRVTMPKVNNLKTEDLNAEQMARLLTILRERGAGVTGTRTEPVTLDPDAREMMLLAIFTGMRRGEIFRLTWEDVDFRRGFITLREPKGGTDQTIPLPDEARELLERRPRRKDCPYIFPGRSVGKKKDTPEHFRPKTDASKHFREIREAAKLPKDFRPMHGLRHVFASMLASSGEVDLYTLQRLLTHKSPTMTQRYAHLTDAALKRGSNVMSRLVKAAEEA